MNIVFLVGSLIIFVIFLSNLSGNISTLNALTTQSSISIPGGSIVTNDGISITDRGISLPGISIEQRNDRGILGNIIDIAGNISSIIERIGERGCVLDSIRGGSSDVEKENYLILGTSCDDTIKAGDKNNNIYAKGGDDLVYSEEGNDIVFSGPGNDRIYGGDDDDLLIGGVGNVLLDGSKGNDILLAGAGETMLIGGDGNDKLFAGPQNTIMYGGKGANTFDCALPALGLARSVVMDYNPSNGDTLSGQCKVLNTVGNSNSADFSSFVLPDTQDGGGSSSAGVTGLITPTG